MSVSPPSTVEDEPLEFDPFSPSFFGDPTEVYRRLRNEAPVYFSEKYGFWALSRWDDVAAAHKDYAAFSSSYGTDLHLLSDPEKIAYKMIIFMDPPEHDRMRALVTRVFTPRAVSQLEPMVRRVIADFADAIGDAERFDLVEQWSALFPVEIISEMLGIPEGDRQDIRPQARRHAAPGRGQHQPVCRSGGSRLGIRHVLLPVGARAEEASCRRHDHAA